ncbi:MAG TPA: hypothetical protein ENJ38_09635, partial [Rhodospirillales bacterium]|nr:hypothetical protein [Rhodospirillales bacterium]
MNELSGFVEQITRALAEADDTKLCKVVGVIDRHPRRGPLDLLIAPHRARLARLRPPRPLSFTRVLTLPLEPALVPEEEWEPGTYRIPRSHLPRLHAAVKEGIAPELESRIRELLAGRSTADVAAELGAGRLLWPAAASVLDERDKGRAQDHELAISLRLAAHLLAIGERLIQTFWHLPAETIHTLAGSDRRAVIALFEAAATRGREALSLVADLVGARCHSPLAILEPLLAGELPLPPRERRECASRIAGACLEGLRVELAAQLADEEADPQTVADLTVRVIAGLAALGDVSTKLDIDKHAVRKLTRQTAELAEQVTRRVLKGIKQAFDDDSNAVPLRRYERAARAVTKIRLVAPEMTIASKLTDLLRCAEGRYAEAFGAFLGRRRQAGKPAALDEPEVMERLRIIELLFGSP